MQCEHMADYSDDALEQTMRLRKCKQCYQIEIEHTGEDFQAAMRASSRPSPAPLLNLDGRFTDSTADTGDLKVSKNKVPMLSKSNQSSYGNLATATNTEVSGGSSGSE